MTGSIWNERCTNYEIPISYGDPRGDKKVIPQKRGYIQAHNRAWNREPKSGNNFNDFYKLSIQMGWEDLHWVDLTLIKLMEVVI